MLTSNRVLVKSIWGNTTQRVTFHGATSRQVIDLIADWKDDGSPVLLVQWAAVGSRAVGTLQHKFGDEIILHFYSSVDQFSINLPDGLEFISYELLDWNHVLINSRWYWREIFKANVMVDGQNVDVTILSKTQHYAKDNLTQWHFNGDRRHIGSIRVKAVHPGFFKIPNVAGGYILVE